MFEGDIKMTGTHASYIKFLASKSNQLNKDALTAGVFKRYIDVYIAGAIIGMVKKLKSNANTENDDSANILADAVIREQTKLKMLYRIAMLIDNIVLSEDERIDLAFRYDTDDEKVKQGLDIFNAYARGGIEWLYQEITSNNASTNEDYLERFTVMVKEFSEDYLENSSNNIYG